LGFTQAYQQQYYTLIFDIFIGFWPSLKILVSDYLQARMLSCFGNHHFLNIFSALSETS